MWNDGPAASGGGAAPTASPRVVSPRVARSAAVLGWCSPHASASECATADHSSARPCSALPRRCAACSANAHAACTRADGELETRRSASANASSTDASAPSDHEAKATSAHSSAHTPSASPPRACSWRSVPAAARRRRSSGTATARWAWYRIVFTPCSRRSSAGPATSHAAAATATSAYASPPCESACVTTSATSASWRPHCSSSAHSGRSARSCCQSSAGSRRASEPSAASGAAASPAGCCSSALHSEQSASSRCDGPAGDFGSGICCSCAANGDAGVDAGVVDAGLRGDCGELPETGISGERAEKIASDSSSPRIQPFFGGRRAKSGWGADQKAREGLSTPRRGFLYDSTSPSPSTAA